MIFERLGSFIVRRYKLILVAWVVGLICFSPLIEQASHVVTYQQQEVSSGQSESEKATAIIDRQFPKTVSNSTILLVISADNVTGPEVRDFLLGLEKDVRADPKIKYFDQGVGGLPRDFISVYTAERFVLLQAVDGMNAGMYQMARIVSLAWGMPAQYLDEYAASMGNDTIAEAAVNATISAVAANDSASGAMLTGLFTLFRMEWNASAGNASLANDSQIRAELAARSAVSAFVMSPDIPPVQAQSMMAVAASFNITTFTDQAMVRAFAVGSIAQGANITDMAFLNGTYDLGDLSKMSAANRSAAVATFVDGTVLPNGTIDTYPVRMPASFRTSFISPDGHVTIVSLSFTKGDEWTDQHGAKPIVDNVKELRSIISRMKASDGVPGLKTYVSGGAAISSDIMETMVNDLAIIEFVTIPLLIILMGAFFRSVVTPVLPLGAVGVALGLSQATVFIIGTLVAGVDSQITTMLFSIIMGVGTDYSIFIIARYREERIKGATRDEAVKTSITWAGESITTSGATVMIAFLSMGIASYSMIRVMGLIMGISILVALLISLTLVPSVLMLTGNRVFWPNNKERFKRYSQRIMEARRTSRHGYFYKAARFSVGHAPWIVAAAFLISIPTTYIFVTAETSFDFIGTMPKVESINGMNAMTSGFGAGRIMPSNAVLVFGSDVVSPDGNFSTEALAAVEQVSAKLAGKSIVHEVSGPSRPYGATVDYAHQANISANDRAKMREFIGQDNRSIRLSFVLNEQPTSKKAVDAVMSIRTTVKDAASGKDIKHAYVGGSTAAMYDTMSTMNAEFNQMEILVVIGIFIVLVVVLGSLLLPAFAILSIGLSISWSFAATFLIFQNLLGVPILWLIPLILFILLMGLGMDYNIFILTRIREEVHKGKSDVEAIVEAVDWTGGIITALALIMGSAIGVLMLSSTMMLAEFGFAISFAILLDAMVVRTYIMPAVMTLLGKWNWYAPGPLQRERKNEKGGAAKAAPEAAPADSVPK